jgi:hypothetical protein
MIELGLFLMFAGFGLAAIIMAEGWADRQKCDCERLPPAPDKE